LRCAPAFGSGRISGQKTGEPARRGRLMPLSIGAVQAGAALKEDEYEEWLLGVFIIGV